jgi:hypothetical protein
MVTLLESSITYVHVTNVTMKDEGITWTGMVPKLLHFTWTQYCKC